MKKVFISYSHESEEHREQVLALSERLRNDGIEANIDRYVQGTPEQQWPRWMLDQVDWADFVLLVCTETYYRRFRGHEVAGKGKGADWEGALITQEIYDARSVTTKFVPVLFDSSNVPFIPDPVRGHTYYLLSSDVGYMELYDFLLDQTGIKPGPVGEPKIKERKQVSPLVFSQTVPESKQPTISSTRLLCTTSRLFGREDYLNALENVWNDPKTNVLTLVAWGGVGKTSLVAIWAAQLAKNYYDGARYFDWTFYSQGTQEQGAASADQFITKALEFFGDLDPTQGSQWDKGERLAKLVASNRTLLILDGIEPLQYSPSSPDAIKGRLKDQAIEALLKRLAQNNPGLCIVTTREHVANLANFRETTAPEWKLHRIPNSAGLEFLKFLGVKGNDRELLQLVEDVNGHALTINLMGRFLVEAYKGDIRKRDVVSFFEADEEIQGGHAFRVIEAYEKWFIDEGKNNRPLTAVLRILGLFDRPADVGCIKALREAPPIPGLTEPLINLNEALWNLTLSRLEGCGLTSYMDNKYIDTHPLIREYFAKQLCEERPKAWRMGHKRLFVYLTKNTKDKPQQTLEDLQPLYQAVAHGCHAGLHEDACSKVYRDRIQRGAEHYSWHRLGAYGNELAAQACFFLKPWSKVIPNLSEEAQSWLFTKLLFVFAPLVALPKHLNQCRSH
jgi:hypothetical protein